VAEDDFPPQFFERVDESADASFYSEPRFVTHIDDATIAALSAFYREFISPGRDVLDLMSSWISHLPPDVQYGRVAGLGMNEAELAANKQLSEYHVQDLNAEPSLPFAADSFDRVMIAVSIQYLTQPVEVLASALEAMRPGGKLCVAMSHRLFPTKAIAAFRSLPPDDRIGVVSVYLERAGFSEVEFIDRSPGNADPLWLVMGTKPP